MGGTVTQARQKTGGWSRGKKRWSGKEMKDENVENRKINSPRRHCASGTWLIAHSRFRDDISRVLPVFYGHCALQYPVNSLMRIPIPVLNPTASSPPTRTAPVNTQPGPSRAPRYH